MTKKHHKKLKKKECLTEKTKCLRNRAYDD